ncbi:MAG: 30S ribosomal protein S4e, partial [Candidatus Altiarchaeota archaeon]|nr:30S ribosomal protein S4e [Candidatus Altiarchaeota archaeon]
HDPSKKGLYPKGIDDKEAGTRMCKIVGKSTMPKGKIQLNLHDGTNILLDKNEYKRKDTLVIDIKTGKVKDSIEFKQGNTAMVVHGRHSGEAGKIGEILPGTMKRDSLTKVGELQTLTRYLFVIGKDKASISI